MPSKSGEIFKKESCLFKFVAKGSQTEKKEYLPTRKFHKTITFGTTFSKKNYNLLFFTNDYRFCFCAPWYFSTTRMDLRVENRQREHVCRCHRGATLEKAVHRDHGGQRRAGTRRAFSVRHCRALRASGRGTARSERPTTAAHLRPPSSICPLDCRGCSARMMHTTCSTNCCSRPPWGSSSVTSIETLPPEQAASLLRCSSRPRPSLGPRAIGTPWTGSTAPL